MTATRIEAIRQRLEQTFHPTELDVIDQSQQHVGHAGAAGGGGHFRVIIQSKAFADKSPLERHRMIYEALIDLMHQEIHALSIDAQPSES